MEPLIYLSLGLVLGLIVGWLLRATKRIPPDTRVEEELRKQGAGLQLELECLREQLAQARSEIAAGKAENGILKNQLAFEREQLESLNQKIQKEFEAISNKLLLDSVRRFNTDSAESLGKLLAPVKETLGEFKGKLENAQKENATFTALLRSEIGRVGTEAANLSRALKGDVKVLGNWGENMLDQILEKSGLQRGLHYRRQQGTKDAAGERRFLDVVVELPEKRNLVIDSKVSLRGYEEYVNCADPEARGKLLSGQIDAIRSHIRGLREKRYEDVHGINSPDFVLMYIPIEGAFMAAVAHEPALFSEALDHNIVLIANSTLLATLRTVAHVWRLADQQKNAAEIADRGGKLYDKFVGFIQDLQNVRASLENAQKSFESATNKLHAGPGNLVRQSQQLRDLGVKTGKTLPLDLLERAAESDLPNRCSPAPATGNASF